MARQEYMDDEVNLMEYIKVIIKQKITILGVVVVCVIVVTIANMQKLVVSSAVRIGNIEGNLYSADEVVEKLKNKNLLQSIISETGANLTAENLKKSIEMGDINGANLIRVQLGSIEPDLAIEILNKVESKFISDGNELYESQIALIKEQVQVLRMRREIIGRQMRDLDEKISNEKVSKRKRKLNYLLVYDTLIAYEKLYDKLTAAEYSLKKSLLTAKSFKIVESPYKIAKPTSIEKKQNLIISAILGLMLGVFIAFSMEFWQRSKEDRE